MSNSPSGIAYYYALQSEARRRVQNSLNSRILREPGSLAKFDQLTLASILSPQMTGALDFAINEWPKYYGEEKFSGFSLRWDEIVTKTYHHPDRFDLAIWQKVESKQVLAGLAVGYPSNARTHLTINWLERYYGYTHIKGRVLLIVLACAEEYARLLGSDRVLIKDPIAPKKYERYGYKTYRHPYVKHGGNYMAKEL